MFVLCTQSSGFHNTEILCRNAVIIKIRPDSPLLSWEFGLLVSSQYFPIRGATNEIQTLSKYQVLTCNKCSQGIVNTDLIVLTL